MYAVEKVVVIGCAEREESGGKLALVDDVDNPNCPAGHTFALEEYLEVRLAVH